jgi:hypothetical protein
MPANGSMFVKRRRNQLLFGAGAVARKAPNSGVRDQKGATVPYHEDPLRNPAASYMPSGYMTSGYDTGRRY